ncbi:MAG TPA: beta-propeller fold lactonase family protein, partial [Thermoanaerobaculia bacterium]|nr:beta-propeller fold lactonase family protein [Thermoanaerobaculia bacterium]
KNLYMPSTDDASLLIFKRQSGSGALSYEDKLEYGETAPEVLAHPVAVAVSGDGNHVYASDVTSEQLAVYRRDRRNGKLTFVELLQEGKYRSLLLSPNGSFLYGLGGIPGNRAGIGIFRRDPTTGKLTPAGDQPSDFSGERFAISRDGKNIYVSLNNESAVAVYQRNATTGQLSLLEVVEDGQGTPDSPSGPTDLAVSPDGKNVYVALANNDGSVAVFRRDPATGRLTLVEALTGISPFSCSNRTLSSATSLAVSPDGGNIYVTSFAGRPFIFSRNRSNGRLSNPNCHFTSATHLAVSPDGRFLYTFDEGRTGIFYRTPTSGRLWSVLRAEGFDTFGGRGNPIAVSPDGKNVYIPAQGAGLVVLGEEGEQSEPSCERLVNGEPKRLCFQDSRFKVEVLWRDFEGREGEASAIPLTADSGFFYFFTRQNIELFVKLLDGRENNDHFWFYYGALSNVEYTILVTDTRRGKLRIYHNPAHAFASAGDISAFPDPKDSRQEASAVPELLALPDPPGAKAGACVEGPTTLCLADGRFQAEMTWKDFAGNQGSGKPGALLPNTNGYFWFFNPENVEVAVKVLDGRGVNGHYWVYYASLTNVEFTLTVTDTVTGRQRTYNNPSGRFASHGDIQALPAN